MLEKLKYFPFVWRPNHDSKEVHGPYFTKPLKRRWQFNDNTLRFNAPSANPVFGFSSRAQWVNGYSLGNKNVLKEDLDSVRYRNPNSPDKEWNCDLFYSNTWYFVGPWFSGSKAWLASSGFLFSADQRSSFAERNLFHPRVFEAAIADCLNSEYGYNLFGDNRKKPEHRGPLNWRVVTISDSIQAVVCDVHSIGNASKEDPLLKRFMYLPVSKHQFIQVSFIFGDTRITSEDYKLAPQLALCNSIIDSMRLEVGTQTKAEWEKVKETCPDMSITEAVGEFPWPLKIEKGSKNSKEVDITPKQNQNELEHHRNNN